jgi:hypothetical protein
LCKHCYDKARRRLGTIDKYPRTKVAADGTMDQRLRNIGWVVSPTGCWLWMGPRTQWATGSWLLG